MTPDDWRSLRELFHQALELPPDDRAAWLGRATGGDTARAAQVLELLRASDTVGSFLEDPPEVAPEDVAALGTGRAWDLLQPGARIGTYEVVREIGRGGMGVVYLARDERLGRDVALKLLPADVSNDPAHRERLRREARAAATITHPSVATVYALEELDGHLVIVSEFVKGRSLRDVIAGSPLPPSRALAVAVDVASALCAAHAAGVVHRDLKPENVLLNEYDAVKVVDFGIAYVNGGEGTRLTQHGAILGTPAYMAPEQLAGVAVDGRADVYALGMLLGEMVTGRHPLAAGGSRDLPPDLAGIVTRCLQPEPGARFASAEALLDALRSVRDGHVELAPRARWWWAFHQGATALAYGGLLVPAWLARRLIGGSLGTALFVVVLVAGIAAITLRLHLWFVSRAGRAALDVERRANGPLLRAADAAYAAGLLGSGLLIEPTNSPLATLLIAGAAAGAVAFLVIEPSTTRAAFPAGAPDADRALRVRAGTGD